MSGTEVPRASPPSEASARFVLGWVRLYTAGLAATMAAERRMEIEADLWDEGMSALAHGPPRSLAPQRLGRLIRGIPADLAWRLDHRTDTQQVREITMRPTIGQWLLLAAAALVSAIGIYGGLIAILTYDPNRWDSWGPYGMLAAGLIGLAGVGLSIVRPAPGLVLAVIGGVLGAFAAPWLSPIVLLLIVPVLVRWWAARQPAQAA